MRFYDPDDLLEALQISAHEILDRFEDKLIRRLEFFYEEFEEEDAIYYEYWFGYTWRVGQV